MTTRLLDVRPGEWRSVARAFVVLLFLVGGLTVLEAARDALLLTEMGPSALGAVYLAVAVLALPAGAAVARIATRLGTRTALVAAIASSAALGLTFFLLPETPTAAFALYVVTALIGALVVPQFWALAGQIFTVAQGRRLLAPVASAGMLGGVLGSSIAAAVLMQAPVKSLLAVAAALFVIAAVAASGAPMQETGAGATAEPRVIPHGMRAAFSSEPFLARIALLVVLSTATLLVVDYLFKWTVAHTVPPAELGSFFARTYVVLNVLSLVVQLVVGAAVVKRLGVAAAVGVTPFLLLVGAGGALVAGGALLAVLVLKGVDGSLRHSIHRITTELLYFPLPRATRERVKPFIDGAAARAAQAVAATALLALDAAGVLTARTLGLVAVVLAAAWLAVAASARRSYLGALRRTLAAGALDEDIGAAPELDLASVEVLVERLASSESADVIAALRVLAARGRERLIPALVLYHPDERVLVEALGIFAASPRADWLPLAERLLAHPDEAVRAAVSRALARQGRSDWVSRLAADPSPRLQAYATTFLALRQAPENMRRHPALAALLDASPPAVDVLLGALDAAADGPPRPQLADLTVELAGRARREGLAGDIDEAVARAAKKQGDPRLVPELLERLGRRVGREAVRQALVAIGKPAADAVAVALVDTRRGREERKHLPRTLARFGTQHAAELLLRVVEEDPDGLVRFNALRGLGRLVTESDVRIDRRRVETLAQRNLVEHLRLDGLRGTIGDPTDLAGRCGTSIGRLLTGLLEDKRAQALERTFRLLKIADRREDLERVHHAARGGDARARANAAEFLDTLLARPDEQLLRQLLRLAIDELTPVDRLARASELVPLAVPVGRDEALLALMADGDATVASLAAYYAGQLGDAELGAAAQRLYEERPTLEEGARRLLEVPRALPRLDPLHA